MRHLILSEGNESKLLEFVFVFIVPDTAQFFIFLQVLFYYLRDLFWTEAEMKKREW